MSTITRKRITFPAGEPRTIQLEKMASTPTTSSITGEKEWRYEGLNGDGTVPSYFYAPESCHKAIQALRASRGDWIRILRDEEGRYRVAFTSDASEPTTSNAQPARASNNGSANKPAASPGSHNRGTSHLAQCLCLAIDAAAEAAEYGRSKGLSVQFLGSDIRAMANSLLINDHENGGRA